MVVHEVNFVTIKNAELKLFSVKMFVSQSFQWSTNPKLKGFYCKQTQLVSPAKMCLMC